MGGVGCPLVFLRQRTPLAVFLHFFPRGRAHGLNRTSALFILVSAGLAVFILCLDVIRSSNAYVYWGVFIGILFIAVSVIVVNVAIPRKQLGVITSIYFGLIVGLFLAYVAGLALTPFLPAPWFPDSERVKAAVQLVLAAVLCYTCVSFLLQTRNDFRFIIPYVEFSKEVKGRRPYILDTSVVIDGRIADVVGANIFDTHLIMPRFVITELQAIADSSDRLRRSRGRRGLDILNNLRVNPKVELEIYDRELPEFAGQSVDLKLVALAKHVVGKLVTNDYNLNKVARLNGVEVVNLNDLANALQAGFPPRGARRSPSGQGRGRGGPGRRLPRRRHHGGGRRRPRSPQRKRLHLGHQRAPDQRRPNGLRPVRSQSSRGSRSTAGR